MTAIATTPLTYNGYVQQLANMAVVSTQTVTNAEGNQIVVGVDVSFNTLLPQALNYAELRIQRDLDLLPSETYRTSYTLTTGSNQLQVSVNDFVTIQTISLSIGTATQPLLPVSKEWLQNIWNDSAVTDVPTSFAMYGGDPSGGNTYNNVLVGPYPNANYPVVITGTVRLSTLYPSLGSDGLPSVGTGTTFISTWLPDLLIQASLVYVSQFQRNFGLTGNDPQMPGSYEAQYQTLLAAARNEEYRKKFEGSAWSALSTSAVATPGR